MQSLNPKGAQHQKNIPHYNYNNVKLHQLGLSYNNAFQLFFILISIHPISIL